MNKPVRVDAPGPGDVAGGVIFLRPLPFEERLGLAIALLLFPIGAHGIAVVVPDHGRWAEAQPAATLLQAPAEIHVVTRHAQLRIETAHGLKPGFPEGHVATRNVLRLAVGEEHVRGSAGGVRDTAGNRSVVRKRDVRAAYACIIGVQEDDGEVAQPIRIRAGIVVDVGDDFAGGGLKTRVAGGAQAAVLRANDAESIFLRDRRRSVPRPVVHHNHFVIRVAQFLEAIQAVPDRAVPVEGAHHNGDPRPGKIGRKR